VAAANLKLRDAEGELLEGLEATGPVAHHHGERWDRLVDAFGADQVTAEEYAVRACQMIEEFRRHVFRGKLEKRLLHLMRLGESA
jgi:hypothetical protein